MTQGQLKDRHITGYGWWIKQERWVFSSFQDSLLNHGNQRGADGCKNGHKETEYGWEVEPDNFHLFNCITVTNNKLVGMFAGICSNKTSFKTCLFLLSFPCLNSDDSILTFRSWRCPGSPCSKKLCVKFCCLCLNAMRFSSGISCGFWYYRRETKGQ